METSANYDLSVYRFFHELTGEELAPFRAAAQVKQFSAGDVIFREGDEGDSIYLLLEGKVEINQALTLQLNRGSGDNREKSILTLSASLHPGFGELALLGTASRRTATVRAMEGSKMAVIGREDFFRICEGRPELGYKVMKNIAGLVADHLIKANQNVLKLTTAFTLVLEG